MSKLTVSQEMSDEQRTEELIMGFSATGADKVFCEVSHLIQAVGIQQADKLMESGVEMQQVVNPNLSQNSTLRTHSRRCGICQVDRKVALEALLNSKAARTKAKVDANVSVPKPKS